MSVSVASRDDVFGCTVGLVWLISSFLMIVLARHSWQHIPPIYVEYISISLPISVTRFGEILPLGRKFWKWFGNFLSNYLLFGKIVNLLWQIFYTFGLICIVINGRISNKNLPIWSHCSSNAHKIKKLEADSRAWNLIRNSATIHSGKRSALARDAKNLGSSPTWSAKFACSSGQCDQIGRFIALWATFHGLW